jgi:murein DD-endopeptidase MepM/ murein hydrolase activator NlpD
VISVFCGGSIYQGQVLGLAGSTGNSSGSHLHFEMRSVDFGRVNPWLYLP